MEIERQQEDHLFDGERQTLQAAKGILVARKVQGQSVTNDDYESLLGSYEKLLRMTSKLAKISDIQGRTLKEQEQNIQQANEHLIRMEQVRKQLAHDISHELGTPMTTMLGHLKMWMDGISEPDPQSIRMLYHKLMVSNRLISDLFQLSTMEAGRLSFQMQDCLAEEWLTQLPYKFIASAKAKGIRFETNFELPANKLVFVRMDMMRMDQVVENLIQNALRFTPEGGLIRVSASLEEPAQGTPNQWMSVEVEDSGEGIAAEDLPYVFERLYRGKRRKDDSRSGSGLGLSICREIIRNHGGTIGAQSTVGIGTTIRFSLPVELTEELAST